MARAFGSWWIEMLVKSKSAKVLSKPMLWIDSDNAMLSKCWVSNAMDQ
jgi:hypothetical protein